MQTFEECPDAAEQQCDRQYCVAWCSMLCILRCSKTEKCQLHQDSKCSCLQPDQSEIGNNFVLLFPISKQSRFEFDDQLFVSTFTV